MPDKDTSLEELKMLVTRFRDERDWKKFHSPRDLSMSISVEAAELLEHFLWKSPKEIGELDGQSLREINEELADVIILCLSMADILNVDVSEIVKGKIKANGQKYPVEKSKGIATKYDKLP